ncbi:MAG: prepilin-type N-terminal cleavage/methylation domain-containing protein [Nostocaceae cyanobacterium]|nr:prepilin-type N-terminal cleavage/methylation domain-containing protein [Nostocaceae cyanobacterium]
MSQIKWFLTNQIKCHTSVQRASGFTLIELLVGIILATLVITPLLGFMINIMDTDRKEQAKSNSEQEIKAALDYMSRDLEQAVYIYDADGIAAIRDKLPKSDQKTNYFPVLVFWKRQFISQALNVGTGTTAGFDDSFVYSLVAYYFIKDGGSSLWSKSSRIGRFQISNGYGTTSTAIDSTRDKGFKLFNLVDNYGTLKDKMNNWQNASAEGYTQQILPLVDYIDQTTTTDNTTLQPPVNCSNGGQQVPQYSGSGNSVADDNLKTGSFYVCVNSANTVVDIVLRGNSLARNFDTPPKYNDQAQSYFPKVSTRVKGRGFLFTK